MKRPLPAALAALLSFGAACDTGFDPQYLVRDLRILGVRAQVEGTPGAGTADAHPGDTVRLDALVANPLARTGVTVTWYGCLPVASDARLACEDPELVRDPARLAAAAEAPERSGVVRLGTCAPAAGEDRCGISFPVPDVPEVQAALDFLEAEAARNRAFRCRLYAEVPVLAVAEASGARARLALKRVRVVRRNDELPQDLQDIYVVNLNPVAGDVHRAPGGAEDCAGGTSLARDGLPAGESVLCGMGGETTQQFNTCGPTGELEVVGEDANWQWYATAGEFPEFEGVGNATGGTVDFARPAGPFTIWGILRDGRGGEGWIRRDVAALP